MAHGNATIEVKAGFLPLAFLLYFTKPTITIDGSANKGVWGTNSFTVTPGKHTVKVAFKYLAKSNTGENSIDVNVAEQETKRISYKAPLIMTAKGKLTVENA